MACSDSEFNFSEFINVWTFSRTPWTEDQPDARPLPTHRTTRHRKTRTYIHASSGIRTRNPSTRAAEDTRAFDRAVIRTGTLSKYFYQLVKQKIKLTIHIKEKFNIESGGFLGCDAV
jgi:hypothetical protein